MKKALRSIALCVGIMLAASLMFATGVGFGCSINLHSKSPLEFCISEIKTHEGYNQDFAYTYSQVENVSSNSEALVINTFTTIDNSDRVLKTKWNCVIEFENSTKVKNVDCDVVDLEVL